MYASLARIRAGLLDLEGTLFTSTGAIEGAPKAVAALRSQGISLRFLTNIDSRPASSIADQLAGYGLDVRPDELFTPVTAAQAYFAEAGTARVRPLVSTVLRGSIDAFVETPPYTHVLVGDCRDTLDYPALDEAFRALRSGAELVALQRGRYFKRADGDHLDTGAVVAALEYAAAVKARVLGKPSLDFFTLAARSAGASANECLIVGDDATTDIAGGQAVGARTAQVRTGKYADQASAGLVGQADHTIDSIAELPELVRALAS